MPIIYHHQNRLLVARIIMVIKQYTKAKQLKSMDDYIKLKIVNFSVPFKHAVNIFGL